MAKSKPQGNLRVGKPMVKPDAASHIPGVREANEIGAKQKGLTKEGPTLKGSARRSTGISPKLHETIDPRMPKLQPS